MMDRGSIFLTVGKAWIPVESNAPIFPCSLDEESEELGQKRIFAGIRNVGDLSGLYGGLKMQPENNSDLTVHPILQERSYLDRDHWKKWVAGSMLAVASMSTAMPPDTSARAVQGSFSLSSS